MKKAVIISDSFKGSLSSKEISTIFSDALKEVFPNCEAVSLQVADGGEGSVEVFASTLKGDYKYLVTHDPLGKEINTHYYLTDEKVAIIEVASSSGLTLIEDKKDPRKASTYGTGEQIKDAILNGAKKIVICLGGSATNDAGCGAASALGVKFYDKNGNIFTPTGSTLKDIVNIDMSSSNELLKGIEITAMCDVRNPMHGLNGAAYIFAPQKGADEKCVIELNDNLKYLDKLLNDKLNKDVSNIAGSGAAGAFGAGILAFMNGSLKSGIDVILDTIKFDDYINDADIIFTGEGKIDGQTKEGKVVSGIINRARKQRIPVVCVVGGATNDSDNLIDDTLKSIVTTTRLPLRYEEIKDKARDFYRLSILNTLRLIKLGEDINKK